MCGIPSDGGYVRRNDPVGWHCRHVPAALWITFSLVEPTQAMVIFFQAMFSILWSIYVNYERDKHAMFLGLFAGRLPGVVYIIPDLVEGS